jgi:heat shock protein HtpX
LTFVVLVAVFGFVLAEATGNRLWLYLGAAIAIIQPLVSYWFSDKLVLAMSGARPLSKQQAPELFRLVENLAITAGLPMPALYVIEDSAPNAFATGRNPQHAAIAVTSGILGKLEKSELEGVLAHELSHVGNYDILIMTLVSVLVGVVVLLADWFRHFGLFGRERDDDNRGSQAQLIFFVVAVLLSILAPLFAYLMQFAVSRKREFLADASGAMLTRNPEALARALLKISGDDEALESANRATAHLYIASPFKVDRQGKVGFWARAFMTHPPIAERVAALTGRQS